MGSRAALVFLVSRTFASHWLAFLILHCNDPRVEQDGAFAEQEVRVGHRVFVFFIDVEGLLNIRLPSSMIGGTASSTLLEPFILDGPGSSASSGGSKSGRQDGIAFVQAITPR